LENIKKILEDAIAKSTYLAENTTNQRSLQMRWNLAFQIDLAIVRTFCPIRYAAFTQSLITISKVVLDNLINP